MSLEQVLFRGGHRRHAGKEISQLEDKLKEIDHVKDVLWYGALADISIPMDMLPDDLKDSLQNADTGSQLMIITFDTSMSADETLDAIEEIRGLTNEQCLLSGMSAVVTDIKRSVTVRSSCML